MAVLTAFAAFHHAHSRAFNDQCLARSPLARLIPVQLPAARQRKYAARAIECRPKRGALLPGATQPDRLPVGRRTQVKVLPRRCRSTRLRPSWGGVKRTPVGNKLPGNPPLLRTTNKPRVRGVPVGGEGRAVARHPPRQDELGVFGLRGNDVMPGGHRNLQG
jgi:hypothetical protein